MNILLLATHFNVGGISKYLVNLSAGLSRKGHKIIIASSPGDFIPALDKRVSFLPLNIKTKSELSPKIFFVFPELIKLIRKNKIEIIHAQTRVSQVLAFYLSKRTAVPFLTTSHGFFKPRLGRRLFPCWGEKVIAISRPVKEHLIKDFKVSSSKIVLIPNGVRIKDSRTCVIASDISPTVFAKSEAIPSLQGEVSPSLRGEVSPSLPRPFGARNDGSTNVKIPSVLLWKKYGLKKERNIIGFVGRLSPVKGIKYLIMAMSDILKTKSDTQLVIVGGGKTERELINLSKNLGIADKVFFLGTIVDTDEILSLMDIFVLPSLQEGLGFSLLEAMAVGKPVVASNVGGISDVVSSGKNGLLVSPGNAKELSKAIIELLKNKKSAEEMGRKARETIREKFSLERMVKETEKVYCMTKRNLNRPASPKR